MNLNDVRKDLKEALRTSGLTQYAFAMKHGISYSSLNKFLKGHAENPRLSSLRAIEGAIAKENRELRRAVAKMVSERETV